MKKVILSILVFSFFLVNTGFIVNLHYCMNKLHSWQVGADDSEKCDSCGMTVSDKNGCCHNEVKVVKLQQDVIHAAEKTELVNAPFLLSFASIYLGLPVRPAETTQVFNGYSPPIISFQEAYIKNRVFRC
jgi:hypothetical protein